MSSDDLNLETVFRTSIPPQLDLIKSVLEAAEIPFIVQGDNAAHLIAGGGFRLDARILVPAERADEARQLIATEAEPQEE